MRPHLPVRAHLPVRPRLPVRAHLPVRVHLPVRSVTSAGVRRSRLAVLLVAVAFLAAKLAIAAGTFGSNDINHWTDFVDGVAVHGPVGIYGIHFEHSLYNHPPLIGYFLAGVHFAAEHGLPLKFTIRAVASLADVVTSLVLFELLRRRRTLLEATAAAILVAASPVLFVISGYHGNTDPDFVMFTLLALYLLVDREMPVCAGMSMALAIGIKIVPVVAVPILVVFGRRRGRRCLARFAAGFGATFLLTWMPALWSHWAQVRSNVLGYQGTGQRQWGFVQLATWVHAGWLGDFLSGSGRFLVVIGCAAVPAAVVWRRPRLVVEAVGLSLAAFMFFSPAFATQYLVWAVAAAYLLDFRWASAYNVTAGVLLIEVYTRWSGGLPWNHATGNSLTRHEAMFAVAPWLGLGVAVLLGVRRLVADGGCGESGDGHVADRAEQADQVR